MHNILIESSLKECITGEKALLRTDFMCTEDNNNLYFKFSCEENNPYPRHKKYNEPLYEGDIVEVMLTLEEKNCYLEIELNQYNAKYCAVIENSDGKGDIIINKVDECMFYSFSLKRQEDGRWISYISLSKDLLKKIGWSADSCYINAYRQDYDKTGKLNLYSLSPTYCATFHVVDSFIKLK